MKRAMPLVLMLCLFLSACSSKDIEQENPVVIKPVKENVLTQSLISTESEFLAMENKEFGIINQIGELVIDPIYNTIYTTASGEYLGKKDQGYDLIRDHKVVNAFQNTMNILEKNYDSYLYENTIGLWRVRKDGKRAYVDMLGKQLSETMFERISPMTLPGDGMSVASNLFVSYEKRDNRYYCAIHTMDGTEIIPSITVAQEYRDELSCSAVQYLANWKDSKHSRVQVEAMIVKDNLKFDAYLVNGTKLIDDADQAEFVWNPEVIQYEKSRNIYYVDFEGIVVDNLKEIAKGQYSIKQKNGLFGVENVDGDVLIPYRYDAIDPAIYAYHIRKDYFQAKRDGKKFVVDVNGNELFEYTAEGIDNTSNSKLWLAYNENWDYQLLNAKGEALIDGWFKYFEVGHFVIAHTADGYRVYDQNASLIYQSEEFYAFPFLDNLPYFLAKENNTIIIKDAIANTIGNYIYHSYDTLFYEKDGITYAKSGEVQLTLDEFDPSQIVFASIQGIEGFFLKYNNQIHFLDDQLHTYYNMSVDAIKHAGNVLLDDYGLCQYFIVEKDDKFALMLESGEFLTEFVYDQMKFVNEYGYIAVRKNNQWGVMNHRGELVVDYVYDMGPPRNEGPSDGAYTDPFYFIGEWYQIYSPEYDSVIYVREK